MRSTLAVGGTYWSNISALYPEKIGQIKLSSALTPMVVTTWLQGKYFDLPFVFLVQFIWKGERRFFYFFFPPGPRGGGGDLFTFSSDFRHKTCENMWKTRMNRDYMYTAQSRFWLVAHEFHFSHNQLNQFSKILHASAILKTGLNWMV